MDEMDALFYVRVDYEQEFNADLVTDNRTFTCMLNEMKADLRGTKRPFVVFYHLVGGLLGLTSILIFYKFALIKLSEILNSNCNKLKGATLLPKIQHQRPVRQLLHHRGGAGR